MAALQGGTVDILPRNLTHVQPQFKETPDTPETQPGQHSFANYVVLQYTYLGYFGWRFVGTAYGTAKQPSGQSRSSMLRVDPAVKDNTADGQLRHYVHVANDSSSCFDKKQVSLRRVTWTTQLFGNDLRRNTAPGRLQPFGLDVQQDIAVEISGAIVSDRMRGVAHMGCQHPQATIVSGEAW
jgi:hypothetical protein